MRRKDTSPVRLWTLMAIGLSVFLAAWLCFLPVFQAAHLAFADHDHTFCLEHHRIEDVPRKKGLSHGTPAGIAAIPLWAAHHAESKPRSHEPCSILGLYVAQESLDAPRRPPSTAGSDHLDGLSTYSWRYQAHGQEILLNAPKTSPPPFATA
jgi:hypothetical protein